MTGSVICTIKYKQFFQKFIKDITMFPSMLSHRLGALLLLYTTVVGHALLPASNIQYVSANGKHIHKERRSNDRKPKLFVPNNSVPTRKAAAAKFTGHPSVEQFLEMKRLEVAARAFRVNGNGITLQEHKSSIGASGAAQTYGANYDAVGILAPKMPGPPNMLHYGGITTGVIEQAYLNAVDVESYTVGSGMARGTNILALPYDIPNTPGCQALAACHRRCAGDVYYELRVITNNVFAGAFIWSWVPDIEEAYTIAEMMQFDYEILPLNATQNYGCYVGDARQFEFYRNVDLSANPFKIKRLPSTAATPDSAKTPGILVKIYTPVTSITDAPVECNFNVAARYANPMDTSINPEVEPFHLAYFKALPGFVDQSNTVIGSTFNQIWQELNEGDVVLAIDGTVAPQLSGKYSIPNAYRAAGPYNKTTPPKLEAWIENGTNGSQFIPESGGTKLSWYGGYVGANYEPGSGGPNWVQFSASQGLRMAIKEGTIMSAAGNLFGMFVGEDFVEQNDPNGVPLSPLTIPTLGDAQTRLLGRGCTRVWTEVRNDKIHAHTLVANDHINSDQWGQTGTGNDGNFYKVETDIYLQYIMWGQREDGSVLCLYIFDAAGAILQHTDIYGGVVQTHLPKDMNELAASWTLDLDSVRLGVNAVIQSITSGQTTTSYGYTVRAMPISMSIPPVTSTIVAEHNPTLLWTDMERNFWNTLGLKLGMKINGSGTTDKALRLGDGETVFHEIIVSDTFPSGIHARWGQRSGDPNKEYAIFDTDISNYKIMDVVVTTTNAVSNPEGPYVSRVAASFYQNQSRETHMYALNARPTHRPRVFGNGEMALMMGMGAMQGMGTAGGSIWGHHWQAKQNQADRDMYMAMNRSHNRTSLLETALNDYTNKRIAQAEMQTMKRMQQQEAVNRGFTAPASSRQTNMTAPASNTVYTNEQSTAGMTNGTPYTSEVGPSTSTPGKTADVAVGGDTPIPSSAYKESRTIGTQATPHTGLAAGRGNKILTPGAKSNTTTPSISTGTDPIKPQMVSTGTGPDELTPDEQDNQDRLNRLRDNPPAEEHFTLPTGRGDASINESNFSSRRSSYQSASGQMPYTNYPRRHVGINETPLHSRTASVASDTSYASADSQTYHDAPPPKPARSSRGSITQRTPKRFAPRRI